MSVVYIYPNAASVIEIKYYTRKLEPSTIYSICLRDTIKLNQRFGLGMGLSSLLLPPTPHLTDVRLGTVPFISSYQLSTPPPPQGPRYA